MNSVVNNVSSLGNVSVVLKDFNISDEANLFNIGKIYKRYMYQFPGIMG